MRSFLKQVLASAIGSLLGLVVLGAGAGVVGLALVIAVAAGLSGEATSKGGIEAKTMLAIDLDSPVRDAPPSEREALSELLGEEETRALSLRWAVEAIARAAKDPKIVGIYLHGDEPAAGLSALAEMRRALVAFRKSGKRVVAYGTNWDERSYWLLSAADRLLLNPFGAIEVNGFASQSLFLGDAFRKYGIDVQTVRAGKYKSAVEPFTSGTRSPENRAQVQALLDRLWSEFKTAAADRPALSPARIDQVANTQGVLQASEAQEGGWVDELAYEDQAIAAVRKLGAATDSSGRSFRQVEPLAYLQASGGEGDSASQFGQVAQSARPQPKPSSSLSPASSAQSVSPRENPSSPSPLVTAASSPLASAAASPLLSSSPSPVPSPSASPSPSPSASPPSTSTDRPSPSTKASPAASSSDPNKSDRNEIALIYATGTIVPGKGETGQIGGDTLARRLRRLREDAEVKAIVLRIDSPGGSATASEVIQRELRLTRAAKPVVVSMGDLAASGGYWIAAYGTKIFAEPTTLTGSIGVFGLLPNLEKLAANNGARWDTVKTSPLADLGTIARPKTAQELALLQRSVDWIYRQFLDRVAEGRRLSPGRVAELAQGRVWSGADAQRLGLVDELGGLETAVREAARLAKVQRWTLVELPKREPFDWSALLGAASLKVLAQSPGLQQSVAAWLGLPGALSSGPWSLGSRQWSEEMTPLMAKPNAVYARLPFVWRID